MTRLLGIFLLVLCLVSMAFADDPGQPDSLIIGLVSAAPYVPSVMLPVYVVTDDPVVDIVLPFRWESADAQIHLAGAYYFNTMLQWDEAEYEVDPANNHIIIHAQADTGGDTNPALNTGYQRQLAFFLRFVIREAADEQFVPVYTYSDSEYGQPIFILEGGDDLMPMTVTGGLYYQTVGVTDTDPNLPVDFSLAQNYPNPFNMDTNIEFALPERTEASLDIYDVLGRHIRTVISGAFEPGRYTVSWNGVDDSGSTVTSGMYFYRLKTTTADLTGKMVLLK